MPTQEQLNAALKAGYSPQQIKLAIAKSNAGNKPAPSGLGGWLTGGQKGIGGVVNAVGNTLNLPSYAIGGLLNRGQQAFGSKYAQGQSQGLGILEGIKNKRGVMSELPETIGVDPNSTAGKVIGFGGELLTPNLPVGKVFKAFKGADTVSDLSKVGKLESIASKIGGIEQDAARTLLEKSYKLNKTNINKIAEAIGVTDEAQKAVKVVDYLEGLGLKGSNRTSLETLNKTISGVQKPFEKLTRTGGQVSRTPYINNILKEAVKQESLNTPASISLSKRLFEEAFRQEKMGSKVLTDTDLSKTISQLWSDVADSAISDPKAQGLAKSLAKSGGEARELLRPGSQQMGRKLRGLITAQEEIGKQANTGLGTQLVNAFKPSAFGAGAGALYGYSTGQDPLKSAGVGLLGGIAINNPKVLNLAGKTLQKGLPKIENKTLSNIGKFGGEVLKRTPSRLLRTYAQPNQLPQSVAPQRQSQETQLNNPYSPILPPVAPQKQLLTKEIKYNPPKSVFTNKSSFGKQFKLKAGY